MLRADIDALPIHEESGVDFHSSIDGRMQHAARTRIGIMIGVARTRSIASRTGGKYLFVFQPAEEMSKAQRDDRARLLDDHRPDACIGLHIVSFMESGHSHLEAGLMWSGSTRSTSASPARADTAG